ncbi:MAG: O-antigen ligase family protein [Candidatus Omnitrophota bacterium]
MKKILEYIKIIFFSILFFIISFIPEPVSAHYRVFILSFLGSFFLILLLDKKILKNLFNFQDWPLWLFLICLSAGIISATNKTIALSTYFYLATNLFFIFFIGKALCYSEKDKNIAVIIICICSGLVAIFGLLEIIFAFNPIYEYFIYNPFHERYIKYIVRPMSTQLNPAPLATYLLITFPFAFYIYRKKKLAKKILGALVIILNITCFLLTFCRSSYLGLITMLFFYQLIKKKYGFLLISFMTIIIISIVAYFLPYPCNRFSLSGICLYGTGIFSQYRTDRILMAWQMLKDSPIFGVGFNHFRILFDKYYPGITNIRYIPHEIKIADNMYLTLAAEAGITGLIGFLIFILSLFKKGLKYFTASKKQNEKQLLLLSMSALAGFLISMAGYETFYWRNPYMFFCLLCGFIQGNTKEWNAK